MKISADALFAVVTTAASILVVIGSPAWNRTRRTRRLATVDLLLANSYIDPARSGGWSIARPASTSIVSAPEQGVDELLAPSEADDAGVEEPAAPPVARRGRDPLTGLLDAPEFQEIVDHEDAREERYRRPTTVVLMELDSLDRLVERLGREAAQRIEPDVADTISRLARKADYVARLAPGRFAVLMPETDEIAAINYVERIRQACEQWLQSGAIAMRLAMGWASTDGHSSVTTAMQVAIDRMHVELRNNARSGDGALADGHSP